MTLSELQALADDKLIELVAVKVMTWMEKYVASDETLRWMAGNVIMEQVKFWNPLTDWNHTMEVVERIESLNFEWRLDGRPKLERGCRIAPCGEFNTPRVQFVADDSGQRAICLAALLALQ